MTQILRIPQVLALTGLSRTTIYRLAKSNEFPKPVKLGIRSSGFREDQIKAWIDSRPTSMK